MARYTGPLCKLCRREGKKLYLKGERCFSQKCGFEKRQYIPGQHGKTSNVKITQYGMQLRAKQSMRRIYGILEKQFRKYFEEARRREGVTGEILVKIVESRLDNAIFRMGFTVSRNQARQFATHGHVLVNGKKVNIPSYRLKPGDVVEIKEKSRNSLIVTKAIERSKNAGALPWLEVDFDATKAVFVRYPNLEETGLQVDVQSIVELYSK